MNQGSELLLGDQVKMDQTIQCAGCRRDFVFTEREETFLRNLVAQGKLAEFVVPKRCLACRQKKRREMRTIVPSAAAAAAPAPARAAAPSAAPSVALSVPHPYVQSAPPPAVPLLSMPVEEFVRGPGPSGPPVLAIKERIFEGKPPEIIRDEEIRIVLAGAEFEQLVCREEILWSMGNKKVRIILADIGFPAMKEALQKAMLLWLKS
jgi:hypothetical protein